MFSSMLVYNCHPSVIQNWHSKASFYKALFPGVSHLPRADNWTTQLGRATRRGLRSARPRGGRLQTVPHLRSQQDVGGPELLHVVRRILCDSGKRQHFSRRSSKNPESSHNDCRSSCCSHEWRSRLRGVGTGSRSEGALRGIVNEMWHHKPQLHQMREDERFYLVALTGSTEENMLLQAVCKLLCWAIWLK